MKPQDLFVLYQTLNCKSKSLPSSSLNPAELGWNADELQAAQKRLQHLGLLDRKTLHPNFDRIRLFLLEAISFWWPSGKVSAGNGLALAIPCTPSLLKSPQKTSHWVWPCDGEFAEGEVIRPLWPELPQLASKDRELHQFFSWVEILRFDQHVAKSMAQNQILRFLENVQTLGSQNFPDMDQDFMELDETQFEILVRFICDNGFKALTLQKASLLTHLPPKYFLSHWETDQSLRLWIAGKFHEQVFQFLNPLIGQMQELNKGHLAMVLESFLDFVESNEDFYRLNLWSYLENDVAIQEMARRTQLSFFETVFTLFKKSKPEAMHKAELFTYLFVSMWRLYAGFCWIESKTLNGTLNTGALKRDIRNLVVRSVFEEF